MGAIFLSVLFAIIAAVGAAARSRSHRPWQAALLGAVTVVAVLLALTRIAGGDYAGSLVILVAASPVFAISILFWRRLRHRSGTAQERRTPEEIPRTS